MAEAMVGRRVSMEEKWWKAISKRKVLPTLKEDKQES